MMKGILQKKDSLQTSPCRAEPGLAVPCRTSPYRAFVNEFYSGNELEKLIDRNCKCYKNGMQSDFM